MAGYFAWWDATQITGLANNAPVATWPDLSANGHNLTQGTGASQPTYVTSGVNTHAGVAFNGSQFLATAALTLAQPFTMLLVLVQTSAGNQVVVDNASGGNFNFKTDTVNFVEKWDVFAGGSNDLEGGTVTTTATQVTTVCNASSSLLRQDRAQVAAGSGTIPGSSGFAAQSFNLAGASGDASHFVGVVGEILVYPSALSAGDITSVETYLHTKWGTP